MHASQWCKRGERLSHRCRGVPSVDGVRGDPVEGQGERGVKDVTGRVCCAALCGVCAHPASACKVRVKVRVSSTIRIRVGDGVFRD